MAPYRFAFTIAAFFALIASHAQQLAFPGAQGFGKYATGGRGGPVYHVTTLADSGAGSFRDAVSQANRIIVFDIGGYIALNSAVTCANNLTIAGQTAPGGGIGVMNNEVSFYGKNNIICRDFRFRQGGSSTGSSAINIGASSSSNPASNMIFDHISVEFGQWDSIDAVQTANVTVQNSIIADPINQRFGAHVEGYNLTWYGNLWVNAHNRQPLAKADTIFINNVIYDFQSAYTTGDTGAAHSHDVINNYFISGPSTTSSGDDFFQINGTPQNLYFTGNILDSDKNGSLGGGTTTPSPDNNGRTGNILGAPWSPLTPTIAALPTVTAYRVNVSGAGALPRDTLDAQVVGQVTSLGSAGAIITSPTSTGLANSGFGTIDGGTALTDSDQDGMPDIWEKATGSNPLVADGYKTNSADGYTFLEDYLNWLAAPHAFVQTNATDIDLWPYSLGFTNGAAYTFANLTNCAVTLTNSHFAHVLPAPAYTGLASFNFSVSDPDGSTMTNTVGLLISTTYIPKNLTWLGDGVNNIWDLTNTADWFDGNNVVIFNSSDNVTFDDTGSASPAINLTASIAPGSIAFNNNVNNYTIGGDGGIGGTASVTMSGMGTLNINNVNSFAGNIYLNSGTLQVNNGASIGSGTGAMVFQNATFNNNYASGTQPLFANPIIVTNNGVANFNLGNRIALSGAVVGSGTLNLNVQSTVTRDDLKGNMGAFTGTVNFLGSGGVRFFANGGAFGGFNNSLVTLNAPVALNFNDNSGGNTYFFGALSGTNASAALGYLSNGSADTLQIGGLNQSTLFAGQFAGPANVVKIGAGTFTVSGASTHTGSTTVSNGTLLVTGNFSSSPVTVVNGATLAGAGVLGGGLTDLTGGIISPGAGNGGVLTVSNFLALNTPTLNFDLTGSPSGTNDAIVVQNGILNMTGTQTYNFNLVNHTLGAGTYSLISGATNANGSVTLVNNLPGSTRQTFVMQRPPAGSGSGYVNLVVTGNASSLLWQGTNGNNWDNTTTNWLNGASLDKFLNLDFVQFDDTSTNGNVNILGTMQPATVLVTNNLLNYTIGGGALAGFSSITKNGADTLILNSSNSFSGGTFVNAGTLQLVTSAYAAGTGPIYLNGGNLYLNGVGTGTTVSSTGTNTLQTSGQPYSGFNLQGSGILNLNIGGGGVFSPSGDWSGFSGTLNFLTGNWIRELNTSTFGSSNAVWNFGSGGIYNKNGGATISLGAIFGGPGAGLSGATTATASLTTFAVGGVNTNSIFNGVISDGGAAATALIFNGPGSLALGGNNTFSGNCTVNGGTLFANTTNGISTGTGIMTINSGGTLGGNGMIGARVVLAAGAMLAPGNNGAGTLTITNDLDLNDASASQFQLGASSDLVFLSGDLTLGGTLNFSAGSGFGAGTYTLFNYGGALNLGALAIGTTPAGYNYTLDTSVQGTINLVVTLPSFGSANVSGGKFILSGFGGKTNGVYFVLTTTNLAMPPSSWACIATNQFDSSGDFYFTNNISPAPKQQFYRLQAQ